MIPRLRLDLPAIAAWNAKNKTSRMSYYGELTTGNHAGLAREGVARDGSIPCGCGRKTWSKSGKCRRCQTEERRAA